ncbi:PSMD4 ATPase, partial [Sclerurus mexicanus]|nr:PSMD4 ATPase [Sclerurus mexicanus]
VDNSEYMRNGDFLPTRLQAQQDAVNIVCHSKTRSNPENNVGLITLANNCEVLTTLTPDTGRILSKLHTVQPKGKITFCTGIRVAHIRNRACPTPPPGPVHLLPPWRGDIPAGSCSDPGPCPLQLVKLAKRLKKEKVNVDIINFGEEVRLAGSEVGFCVLSHGEGIQAGPQFSGSLLGRPGAGQGCPEQECRAGKALEGAVSPQALRVSMEEQRQRQEEEARRAAAASAAEAGIAASAGDVGSVGLWGPGTAPVGLWALALPLWVCGPRPCPMVLALPLWICGALAVGSVAPVPDPAPCPQEEDDYDVMQDPEFLQSVLENLPGVDPNNEAIRNAMGSLASQAPKDAKDRRDEDKK